MNSGGSSSCRSGTRWPTESTRTGIDHADAHRRGGKAHVASGEASRPALRDAPDRSRLWTSDRWPIVAPDTRPPPRRSGHAPAPVSSVSDTRGAVLSGASNGALRLRVRQVPGVLVSSVTAGASRRPGRRSPTRSPIWRSPMSVKPGATRPTDGVGRGGRHHASPLSRLRRIGRSTLRCYGVVDTGSRRSVGDLRDSPRAGALIQRDAPSPGGARLQQQFGAVNRAAINAQLTCRWRLCKCSPLGGRA
jgi:hypothetical protein